MLGVICTLIAVVAIAYFVIKNYYPPVMLLLIGLVMLVIGAMMGNPPVSPKTTTNFVGFDLAQALTDLMKSRLGGLGLNIMAIAGFSYYMNKLGASKALVKLCIKPLAAIRSPYLLLGVTYLVGQTMALFINSAVGLGLLLMASVYPLLVSLGVRRAAAAKPHVALPTLRAERPPERPKTLLPARVPRTTRFFPCCRCFCSSSFRPWSTRA